MLVAASHAQAPLAVPALPAIDLRGAAWVCDEAGVGVEWCHRQYTLFDAPQSLSILRVELNKPGVRIRFAEAAHLSDSSPSTRLERTSDIAARTPAIAAVNGDFFDGARHAGPFMIDGEVRSFAPLGHAQATATFGFDRQDQPRFWSRGPDGWLVPTDILHAISAGPMLLRDAVPVRFTDDDAFARTRHPRTGVCTAPGRMIDLVVADGRAAQAAGLSLPELASVMRALGCTDAMNLDGGGSSTMWLRHGPGNGVVNHPSDNRRFDQFGERAVAGAVIVIAPEMVTAGARDATRVESPSAVELTWELRVHGGGDFKVFLRVERGAGTSHLDVEIDKKPVAVEVSAGQSSWVEVGAATLKAVEGLRIEPTIVTIVVRSPRGEPSPTAVRLVQQ